MTNKKEENPIKYNETIIDIIKNMRDKIREANIKRNNKVNENYFISPYKYNIEPLGNERLIIKFDKIASSYGISVKDLTMFQ